MTSPTPRHRAALFIIPLAVFLVLGGCTSRPGESPSTTASSGTMTPSTSTQPPSTTNDQVLACNAAGQQLEQRLPAQARAGSVCRTPATRTLDLYIAASEAEFDRLRTAVLAEAERLGARARPFRVRHSRADIEARLEPRTWSKTAFDRLTPHLMGAWFDAQTNSLRLSTTSKATWTEAEASALLGVRVTRVISDETPIVKPKR